jgi:ABC-2 type transport system ATP-binding protein
MFEAELVCDRILLIDKGSIVTSGTPEELKNRISDIRTVVLQVRRGSGDLNTFLNKLAEVAVGGVMTEELGVDYLEIKFNVRSVEESLNKVMRLLTEGGLTANSFKVVEPTLEDVFIYFTGGKHK